LHDGNIYVTITIVGYQIKELLAGADGGSDWGPGLRIYLAKDGLKIIILIGGGTKKRQQQDIEQAVALWQDYKRRKASIRQGK